jgi:KUP system potassium uptake protein
VTFYVVTRRTWGWSRWRALPLLVFFLSFDLPFFAANLLKFFDGGYVPVIVGAVFFVIMVMWRVGRNALAEAMHARATPVATFLATVDERVAARVPGTAIFMTSSPSDVPGVVDHHIRRIRVLHARVVLLTVVVDHVPYVTADARATVEALACGFTRVVVHYGFMDEPDVPAALAAAAAGAGLDLGLADATWYVGRETFLGTHAGRLGPVREGIFALLARNASTATSYFGLPPEQVVELGTQIDL